MSSLGLREQLGMSKDPDFVIDVPEGWSRRDVTSDSMDSMLESLKTQFMRAHQPAMYASMKRLVGEAFAGMKQSGAVGFYAPVDAPEGTFLMPASIIVRIKRADGGASLDAYVRTLIDQRGAEKLFGDPRTLRFEERAVVRVEGQEFINNSVTYLSPIPGSSRKRAVEFVASLVSLPQDENQEWLAAQKSLIDLCIASLRWRESKN